jgi:phospholipase C
MLGYLSRHGGRADVDGLRGGEKNRYKGRDYPSFPLTETVFNKSPCHRHDCIEQQINGGQMDGFVADFARHYEEEGVDPGKVMGYYQAVHVDVYDALAKAFLICQRWFAAHPGPTFPNRFYTLTGRLNRDAHGLPETDNPQGDVFKPVFTRTLFDHLTEHGVSWRYYEHRYCFLRMFERYTFDDNYYIVDAGLDAANLVADITAGRLPSVTFIDPNFIDEPDGDDNDDAPPADIARGQRLIGQVVNAVMNSPKWGKTLLIITYDEHGGFYDHVNPLLFSEKAKPVSGIGHYGVRVPTFVVSPWVDQNKVSSDVFDHTSIAKTIIRRFMSANPPDMGERVAVANDLSMVLRPTAWQDRPSISVPPAPGRNVALTREAAPGRQATISRSCCEPCILVIQCPGRYRAAHL